MVSAQAEQQLGQAGTDLEVNDVHPRRIGALNVAGHALQELFCERGSGRFDFIHQSPFHKVDSAWRECGGRKTVVGPAKVGFVANGLTRFHQSQQSAVAQVVGSADAHGAFQNKVHPQARMPLVKNILPSRISLRLFFQVDVTHTAGVEHKQLGLFTADDVGR